MKSLQGTAKRASVVMQAEGLRWRSLGLKKLRVLEAGLHAQAMAALGDAERDRNDAEKVNAHRAAAAKLTGAFLACVETKRKMLGVPLPGSLKPEAEAKRVIDATPAEVVDYPADYRPEAKPVLQAIPAQT